MAAESADSGIQNVFTLSAHNALVFYFLNINKFRQ